MPRKPPAAKAMERLRTIALSYPEATEEFPWGDRVIKVRGKIFVFLGAEGDRYGLSVKLPVSSEMALTLPFTAPSGYGLGRAGWVTCSFGPDDAIPVDLLAGWIDQSFRAVAPKKLVASLDPSAAPKRKQAHREPV